MLMDGFLVFLGVLAVFIKLPLRWVLLLLGRPLWTDLGITLLVYFAHLGTIRGMLTAAVAGLLISGGTSIGRYMIGYIYRGVYYPGYFPLDPKRLVKQKQAT